MSSSPHDDYLERVKAEIRADAETARTRAPLPRIDPPPRAAAQAPGNDGIERERLDYAIGELTGADYIAFLEHAFRALLKRPPDDAGSAAQIRLLAAGASKAEVLGNLRWSPEGRRVGARVRGLLPRYVLAKLTRVPVLGYALQWGLALAGLPLLLRHQRAADTAIAARFNAVADAGRAHEQRLAELHDGLAALRAEHERRSAELRDEILRMLPRLDELEHRSAALEGRTGGLEQRGAASAHELIELRHYVHAANHWVASLQASLGELEDAAAAEQARTDAFAAAIGEEAADAHARTARYAAWSAALAARLAPSRAVLDLGSGDGAWLAALVTHAVTASGVEANPALVERAQQRRLPVALGDPQATLARCADASLDGVTLGTDLLVAPAGVDLLHDARRALRPGGHLLLRVEALPYRLDADAARPLDAARWSARLAAAGFATPSMLDASGGSAVLARRADDAGAPSPA